MYSERAKAEKKLCYTGIHYNFTLHVLMGKKP